MVTSNIQPDTKIVKMAEQNNSAVVPQRTLLGEVNEHITCPLCRGYYIDATTIVECLHSFCRSCIIKHLQVKSYCPVCEMMINSAKPNIKPDKALQDIVYKLVPGLFQKEMERRQTFYASRPGPAASATPEQRGEDTERIIFSPEDVISFSLEYVDATDTDSISSKSSDSNESQTQTTASRRFLQCPAVVNISHLKKFLSMKFDIDSSQFAIVILYKKVPLPDYYTLMDVAYIYNWKRNEPMRFFYQIIDYVAIRNRLFDNNRKRLLFPDRKSSPATTEDTNDSSPAPNINDHGSEASSGTDSPMLEDNSLNKTSDSQKKLETSNQQRKDTNKCQGHSNIAVDSSLSLTKRNDDEVEKSQFLNSFELTAKNNSTKSSPSKSNSDDNTMKTNIENTTKSQSASLKNDDNLKRKQIASSSMSETKKARIEDKSKIIQMANTTTDNNSVKLNEKANNNPTEKIEKIQTSATSSMSLSMPPPPAKDVKQHSGIVKQQPIENPALKRTDSGSNSNPPPKHQSNEVTVQSSSVPKSISPAVQKAVQKTVSPLKLQIPKQEVSPLSQKPTDLKPVAKKMPDLRPSGPGSQMSHNKSQVGGKLRMDLLANNSDPTIDRAKLLPQVKTPLSAPVSNQTSGDPLKSLFDSCKINIPPSLSITLTDQKMESRSPCDPANVDQKKGVVNKNLTSASNVSAHKAPSPPVHNYIEILKLPETDPKKVKLENDPKINTTGKVEGNVNQTKPLSKPSETSNKGPVPNLKPIADTKLGKQSGSYSAPITFQQTFEQQLQSMQTDKKGKPTKNKAQVPKLVPANPKTFPAVNKLNVSNPKAPPINIPLTEHKLSTALDLSTPHNIQSQLGPQQSKAFETMQSIANLAKKQNLPNKVLPLTMTQSNVFSNLAARPLTAAPSPLRVPSTSGIVQPKIDKPSGSQMHVMRQEVPNKSNIKSPSNINSPTVPSSCYPMVSHSSPNPVQSTPRPQTRSPSSSPKLVIAEDKQGVSGLPDQNINQSNQITSTQVSNMSAPKSDSPKASPGPSKPAPKPLKPMIPAAKMSGMRHPIPTSTKPTPPMASPADYLTQRQILSAQHAMLRHQMDLHGMHFQNPWLKAQQQYDLLKNMSNMANNMSNNMPHQQQNDFNKDKQ